MNKDQTYHQIALACLKTLRSPNNAAAQDPSKALYHSIDQAFEQQYALLLAELADCQERLNAICALETTKSLADAQAIASHKAVRH